MPGSQIIVEDTRTCSPSLVFLAITFRSITIHVNAHLAFGASVTLFAALAIPIQLSYVEVAACIVSGCIIDGDYVFTRFLKSHNHRMLPTHSMIVPIIFFVASLLVFLMPGGSSSLAWTSLLCGINILVHELLDSIDWGLNLFLNRKLVGKKILLGGCTTEEFYKKAQDYKPIYSYFFKVYYDNKVIQAIEIASFSFMLIAFSVSWHDFGDEFWWVILVYSGFLALHVIEYKRGMKAYKKSHQA